MRWIFALLAAFAGAAFAAPELEAGVAVHAPAADQQMSQTQSLNLAGVMTTSAVEAQSRYSQTNVLQGVSANRTTVTATPDARFKALYGAGTNAGAVDAQRNAITQEANKALTAGALPTIHGNQ
jgi:hypothetical protein